MILRLARALQEAVARRRHPLEDRETDLTPDDLSVVNLTADEVRLTHPDGTVTAVSWPGLKRVEVEAAEGVWGRTICWVLSDEKSELRVPQGSMGEVSLLAALQALPNWDNGAVVAALRSSQDYRFECWAKDGAWRRPKWRRGGGAGGGVMGGVPGGGDA